MNECSRFHLQCYESISFIQFSESGWVMNYKSVSDEKGVKVGYCSKELDQGITVKGL